MKMVATDSRGLTENSFTLFNQQRDQVMRNMRSTPGSDFRDFRTISSLHSTSPNNSLDFGGEYDNLECQSIFIMSCYE